MKVCGKCKVEKALTEFNKCSRYKDGLQNSCRVCAKAKNADWYTRNAEKAKEYSANYYAENRVYYKEYHKTYTQNNRAYKNLVSREWTLRNKEKRRVTRNNYRARYPGVIANMNLRVALNKLEVKPDACEACGNIPQQLNGHHDDYAKPKEIRWLCPACHSKWHRENGPGLNKHLLEVRGLISRRT